MLRGLVRRALPRLAARRLARGSAVREASPGHVVRAALFGGAALGAGISGASTFGLRSLCEPAEPYMTSPVNVVDTAGITITEFFGNVASKDGAVSLAIATVKRPDEAGFQAPQFAEYVIVNEGALELVQSDLTLTRVEAGEGVYLPAGLRVKWTWPVPCSYTVVCLPAFSPLTSGSELNDPSCTVVDVASRARLAELHSGATGAASGPGAPAASCSQRAKPQVVRPVAVVESPGITITEHFGNVASNDSLASLRVSVVSGGSQEAWQSPGVDEYVVCTQGAIEFFYGKSEHKRIVAGQGIFLPKGLSVKWVWPEPAKYSVLCLPAFSPKLGGGFL